jgi:hypothetical protein
MGSQFVSIEKADGTNRVLQADTTNGDIELKYQDATKLTTTTSGINVQGSVVSDGIESTCAAGDGNLALQAYHPTSTSARDIAKFQSNVGGTQVDQMVIGCDGNVDINGTVTADGLTVSGATEFQDNPVISNDSPELTFETTNASHTNWQIAAQESLNQAFEISSGQQDADASDDTWTKRFTVKNDGDISFYDSTGVTQGFFWDASTQRLGLGTSSPDKRLDVLSGTSNSDIAAFSGVYTGRGLVISTFENTDPDAGVDFDAISNNGTISFSTDSTEAIRIDSSQNVGIGTTPEDWNSAWVATQVGSGSSLVGASGATSRTFLSDNAYADGSNQLTSWKYMSTNEASLYAQLDGTHSFRVASSGTADTAITWSEAMRITSSGNVGIGITNPVYNLVVSAGGASGIEFGPAYSGTANLVQHYNRSGAAYVDAVNEAAQHRFSIGGTEKMRIDSSGNLLVGGTSYSGIGVSIAHPDNSGSFSIFSGSGTGYHWRFGNFTNGVVGSITTSTSATSYNTSSDYRLKENVTDVTGAADRVKALNPVRFNFIADPDTTVDGFLAHEVQDVVPEAITGTHNEVDDDGNPVYQGIDQSKLVPLLTAALQEALTKIDDLETRLAALEAN